MSVSGGDEVNDINISPSNAPSTSGNARRLPTIMRLSLSIILSFATLSLASPANHFQGKSKWKVGQRVYTSSGPVDGFVNIPSIFSQGLFGTKSTSDILKYAHSTQ